jgi:hypothetical protein
LDRQVVKKWVKECEVVPFKKRELFMRLRNKNKILPSRKKYKPNSTQKKREQFMRLRNKNKILPPRKNHLCAAAEGNINLCAAAEGDIYSTEGHTHKGRGATEREDGPQTGLAGFWASQNVSKITM